MQLHLPALILRAKRDKSASGRLRHRACVVESASKNVQRQKYYTNAEANA